MDWVSNDLWPKIKVLLKFFGTHCIQIKADTGGIKLNQLILSIVRFHILNIWICFSLLVATSLYYCMKSNRGYLHWFFKATDKEYIYKYNKYREKNCQIILLSYIAFDTIIKQSKHIIIYREIDLRRKQCENVKKWSTRESNPRSGHWSPSHYLTIFCKNSSLRFRIVFQIDFMIDSYASDK